MTTTAPVPENGELLRPPDEPESRPGGVPLYVWVVAAVLVAVPTGLMLGERARGLQLLSDLVLRALGALAAPMVVLAVLTAIVTNEIRGRLGALMMGFYLVNTLVAMAIGLALANLFQPGLGASLAGPGVSPAAPPRLTVSDLVLDLVPRSLGEPWAENHLAQLVLLALVLGIGLVRLRDGRAGNGREAAAFQTVVDLLTIGFELFMKVLLWVVALVPVAVFGTVAATVGHEAAMKVLASLARLIEVVALGLALQVCWYLFQMAVLARTSPVRFLKGSLDVMSSTFSTSSTAATIPITLGALARLGISRRSSQMAACIGTNFNNDGTALYQASAVLFLAQALGFHLSFENQIVLMLTTLIASVGAGGIPSGSFVTLPLIFNAVQLPMEKLPILLTIDWLLDRLRTTSNVLGDMTVAVLLDWAAPPGHAPSGPADSTTS